MKVWFVIKRCQQQNYQKIFKANEHWFLLFWWKIIYVNWKRMTGRIVHSFKHFNRLEIVVNAILSASIFLDNLSNFIFDNIDFIEFKTIKIFNSISIKWVYHHTWKWRFHYLYCCVNVQFLIQETNYKVFSKRYI